MDDVDVKILKILQADGRTALSEIARRLEMGNATIHERVDSLEADGYIKEYRAVLEPALLDIDQVAFVHVRTDPGDFSSVAERLAEESDVQEIHEVTGDFDLMLKVRVRERSELTELLTTVGGYDGVLETSTDVALRSVKEDHTLNLEGV
ncbi:MAG: Lrp/AsnC family transcriptional regulator [Halanaeroarchaeum sp.]